MPVCQSQYKKRPYYFFNAHLETIVPSLLFKVEEHFYTRERIELDDGDFLDLDWVKTGSKQCMVISHGLEGSSDRYYVKRTARYFKARGWDIAAWNCRSCSGEMNRLPRFYHHGETNDLATIINRVFQEGYNEVVLFGYSMGGSMALKYLGERETDERLKGAMTFSVPCNLRDSAIQLLKKGNRIYERKFLKKLIEKVRVKALNHPEVSIEGIEQLNNFDNFHDKYTAPLHGFKDKEEFFNLATCDRFLNGIKVPVLIVNAANDPMLGKACYPWEQAESSDYVYLEVPKVGGHCGFTIAKKPYSYMEVRADAFIRENIILSQAESLTQQS